MIKNLRWKLTAFNTAITGAILLGMTLFCLLMAQGDAQARAFQNFYGYMSTISTNLSSQKRISMDWIRQMEEAGQVEIFILDGGQPLFSSYIRQETREDLCSQIRSVAEREYGIYGRYSGSCAVSLEAADGSAYFAGVVRMEKSNSMLEVILLHPLQELEQSIRRQQMVALSGGVLAILALWVFSWYFTGRMLQPIRESQQRQARFTAAASHELRTPLTAILSSVSALERSGPEQQPFFLGLIRQEGQRMSRLIGDLLSLSSGDSQNWNVQMETLEPDMLLLNLYERYLPRARDAGMTLGLELQEEIPSIRGDRERLDQLLAILLDNALAYTPAPGRICLRLSLNRGNVRFSVSDTGPGVPDGEKQRIFERFHRGQQPRSDRTHFGLGLSIACQIAQLHGGRLWAEDAPEGGAAFLLELPHSESKSHYT